MAETDGDGVATRLEDVRIGKLALVRRPANQRPLLLLKSEDAIMDKKTLTLEVAESMIPVFKSVVEPAKDEDATLAEALKADLSDEEKNKVRMALRLLSSLGGKISASIMSTLSAAAGVQKDEGISKADHEAAVTKAVDAAVAKALKEAKPPARKVLKSKDGKHEFDLTGASDAEVARTEALVKSLDEAHQTNEELRTESRHAKLLKTAGTDYPHLDGEKVATVLRKSEDAGDAEATKALREVLKQAEEIAKAGGLEVERGARGAGGGGGDAWSKIQSGASALRKSIGADKLSDAAAMKQFLDTTEGKALYDEYRAEQKAS